MEKKNENCSYPTKEISELTGSEMKLKIEKSLDQIVRHYYNKRQQSKTYHQQLEDLKVGEALIHVDYSENYKNKQLKEIKAAYYGQGQFSLYTVCAYVKNPETNLTECLKMVYVTEENDHSCNVTFALNDIIIKNLIEANPNLNTFKFWSDGCGSQFRSQYAFFMLTRFRPDLSIEWHFFEANHGKGAVDGLGGSVKHAVWRRVMGNRLTIRCASEFADEANKICPGITVKFVATKELNLSYHIQCRNRSKAVPKTLQVHSVKREVTPDAYTLSFYATSTSSTKLNATIYKRNVYYIEHELITKNKLNKVDGQGQMKLKLFI